MKLVSPPRCGPAYQNFSKRMPTKNKLRDYEKLYLWKSCKVKITAKQQCCNNEEHEVLFHICQKTP